MTRKLGAGLALLLYRGEWQEAVTDELARESAEFTGWAPLHQRVPESFLVALGFDEKNRNHGMRARMACFRDIRDRRWMQPFYVRSGIMVTMIVKVQMGTSFGGSNAAEIVSKDGSLRMFTPLNGPLAARMRGATTKFFQADVANGVVELGDAMPDQGW